MLTKLKILFKYGGFFFIGHVQRNEGIYNVHFALFDSPSELETVRLYRGKGKDERAYWRQRVDEASPHLKDPELVELIGKAIQEQEINKLR